MTFTDLGLSDDVLRAVDDAGYTEPTPIQAQAIPVVLMGRDILGSAQTGTGKTAGFTLPMIDILASGRAKARMPRSLIIEPTRELAAQVAENFETYGKYHSLTKALLVGGTSFVEQQKLLDRGVDVLIATPGRLLDLFERGKILLSDVKILVIDEADRMLDMGFIPDVERIVGLLPKLRQTLFFSATMPPEIRRLADQFLMNPKEISVAPPATPAETIKDIIAIVPERDKTDALRRFLRDEKVENALIFCNRKRDVDVLARSLKRSGFNAAPLHGDMPQVNRTATLAAFRSGEIGLLVASDVAARGLDISELPYVINFDVPYHAEDYVHRIGRTGRAGRVGHAFTLGTRAESKQIAAIERLIGRPIPRAGDKQGDSQEPAPATGRREPAPAARGRKPAPAARGRKPAAAAAGREPAPATMAAAEPAVVEERPVAEVRPAAEEKPATEERTAAEDGGRRRRRGSRSKRPKPAETENRNGGGRHPAEPREDREATGGRGRRGGRGDRNGRGELRPPKVPADAPTIGMGDHMPAFLSRPARANGDKS